VEKVSKDFQFEISARIFLDKTVLRSTIKIEHFAFSIETIMLHHTYSSLQCLLLVGLICLALQEGSHCHGFAPTRKAVTSQPPDCRYNNNYYSFHSAATTTTTDHARLNAPAMERRRPPRLLLFANHRGKECSKERRTLRQYLSATVRRYLCALCLVGSLMLGVSPAPRPALAVSGGRMGGTFTRSSSSGSSSSPTRSSSYASRGYTGSRSSYRRSIPTPPIRYYSTSSAAVVASPIVSTTDMIFIGGVGFVIYNSIHQKKNQQETAVVSLTACLAIPDRTGPDSFVNHLNLLSNSVDTTTRQGVQELVSNVALQLLRQESSIVSAVTSCTNFRNDDLAQQAFYQISTIERAKFDRETIHKFGTANLGTNSDNDYMVIDKDSVGKATYAVVTLTVLWAARGIRVPSIVSRGDLRNALHILAASVPGNNGDETLLGGEVLWAPTGANERLTMEQVHADYPNLFPVY
jgi:uncharacterized membrane protein